MAVAPVTPRPQPAPSGPRGHLLTGHLPEVRRDALGFFTRCARDYGDFVPLRFGPKRVVLLSHPSDIEAVLVTNSGHFGKSPGYRLMRHLLGDGLLTSDGDTWRRQRRLLQPAFHAACVAAYGKAMVDAAERMLATWRDGEIRDLCREMAHLTLEIVAKVLFGADVARDAADVRAALAVAREQFNARTRSLLFLLPMSIPTPGMIRFRRAARRLDDIIYGMIERRRASGEDRGDLLSLLLAAHEPAGDGLESDPRQGDPREGGRREDSPGKGGRDEDSPRWGDRRNDSPRRGVGPPRDSPRRSDVHRGESREGGLRRDDLYEGSRRGGGPPPPAGRLTDEQIRDEVATFLLAGHETTALALSWTWYLLSQYPGAEAKLAAELDTVLGGRPPTVEDLPRLAYAGRVVLEALRLYPPAYSIGREALRDCEIGGRRVRAGTIVLMSQWVVHRDPRFFADPDAFNPDRWADGLAQRLPRFAFFPFGGGARRCIGGDFAMTEAVLLLAAIARRFRLVLVPGQEVTPEPLVSLHLRGGLRMRLERR